MGRPVRIFALLVQLGGDFFQIIGVKLLDLAVVHGGGNGGVDGPRTDLSVL